ncbi:MAG: hypothetical protein V8T16_07230 [Parabacteroides merdae]
MSCYLHLYFCAVRFQLCAWLSLPESGVSVPTVEKVASITDKIHVGTTKNYWQYLSEMLGLELLDYGIISSRTVLAGGDSAERDDIDQS